MRPHPGTPYPDRGHVYQRYASVPSPRRDRRRLHGPVEGIRETEPLLLILLAVAVPVALVALAATGGGIPLLALAIAVTLAVCYGIAAFINRLMRTPPNTDDTHNRDPTGV